MFQVLKGHFSPNDVHKQYGIAFTTPPFPDQNITEKFQTALYLYKPSEQAQSDPKDFYFEPRSEKLAKKTAEQNRATKRTKAKPAATTSTEDDPSSSKVPPPATDYRSC